MPDRARAWRASGAIDRPFDIAGHRYTSRAMGASASLKQPSVSVDPGGQATVEIQVKNTGTVVDQFTIEVLGDAGIWATADPPTLSLFPETQGSSQITFRPPREPSTPAATIAFGVMVRSHEDPPGSAVEEGS